MLNWWVLLMQDMMMCLPLQGMPLLDWTNRMRNQSLAIWLMFLAAVTGETWGQTLSVGNRWAWSVFRSTICSFGRFCLGFKQISRDANSCISSRHLWSPSCYLLGLSICLETGNDMPFLLYLGLPIALLLQLGFITRCRYLHDLSMLLWCTVQLRYKPITA